MPLEGTLCPSGYKVVRCKKQIKIKYDLEIAKKYLQFVLNVL